MMVSKKQTYEFEEIEKEFEEDPQAFLFLNHLESLSLEQAEILSKWEGNHLVLNGLKSLTPECALTLAKFKGKSFFLRKLPPHSLYYQIFNAWSAYALEIREVQELDASLAFILGQYKGERLFLNLVKKITPETASLLAEYQGG